MDYRLSYMESVEDGCPPELASINPCVNLKDALSEADLLPNPLKVYLRIRPCLPDEKNEEENIEILNDETISMVAASHAQSHKSNPKITHNFSFSHVYGRDSTQKELFDKTTSDLVKDIVSGQNCLLFTYGATNSGKTYTLQGTEREPGLLPRTLVALFDSVGDRQYLDDDLKPHHFCSVVRLSHGEIIRERDIKDAILKTKDFTRVSTCSNFSYASCSSKEFCERSQTTTAGSDGSHIFSGTCDSFMTDSSCFAIFVSFVEIYNEYTYDLLEHIKSQKNVKRTPLVLGEDKHGAIYIKGLKHIKVCDVEEALKVMEVGRQNLHFASTQLNQNSSRSHCIFTIKLVQLFDPANPHMAQTSMLSLCDLAGAEKSTKTMGDNFRLKEASNINTSLLVLGRCIAALRHNQTAKHSIVNKRGMPVPYRDSKVTRLFQSFFMGKGKLSMIVNICTSTLVIDDTLRVLKFSAIARKVAIVPNKAYADHNTEHQRERSRLSRFLRQSLNMSKASIRLSVPWANSTTRDVTFGAVDEEEETDTTHDETYYEEEGSHEVLLDLVKKLRDRLMEERKEKLDMEKNLRKEICDNFSQMVVKIQNSYTRRIEEERCRNEELMDWRVNRALETTDLAMSTRKRRRLDEDDGGPKRGSPVTMFQDVLKLQEITEEMDLLKEELTAVKATLKSTIQTGHQLQEQNSKLTFKMSVMSESLDDADRDKEKMEVALKDALAGTQHAESAVIETLQKNIDDLTKDLNSNKEENNTIKIMLTEAAEEFIEKEQKLATAQETLAQQNTILSDLESQVFEGTELLASQATRLDERERRIAEMQEDLQQFQIAAETVQSQNAAEAENFPKPKCTPKNRTHLLKHQTMNQSLIDFENSEKKINIQHIKNKQANKLKYLEESLSKSERMCQTFMQEIKVFTEAELLHQSQLEAKDKQIASLQTVQTQLEALQITNEELQTENATMKFVLDNAEEASSAKLEASSSAPALDRLSQSVVNNEDLSRTGDAPVDADNAHLEEIEDLRLVLESLDLQSVQELKQNLLDVRCELGVATKKLNETDEELVCMCKLNESLQNELLANMNRINFLESDLYGQKQKHEVCRKDLQAVNVAFGEASLKLTNCREDKVELKDMKVNLTQLKEMNSKFATDAATAKEKEAKLTSQVETYALQVKELSSLQTKVAQFELNKISMDEERSTFEKKLLSAELSSQEKNSLVDNLTKKLESLDMKLCDSENSNVSKTRENELLSKQLAAIVEARKQELIKFEQEKDCEIASLQKELKELLAGSKKEVCNKSIKQEEDGVQLAAEQLRQSEFERSSLVCRVADLEKQLSQQNVSRLEINQSAQFDEFVTPVPKTRTTRGLGHLETPIETAEPLTTSRSTRKTRGRGRGRGQKKNAIANPHIPDEKDKENHASVTSENTRSTRRNRPLYTVTDDLTFDGSPNLMDAEQARGLSEESPHTISRRQLRSKFK